MEFDISFLGAAAAGLLAFFSPCVLPMVPFYLSYLAGMSVAELRGDGAVAPGAQRRLLLTTICFALGVTTIFGLLGLGSTALGQGFQAWLQELRYLAAAIIALFGLHFLGVLRLPFLMREARLESKADPSTIAGAYVMGLAFGFGWTACVGPVLASIMLIAATKETLLQGASLLVVFGLAMTAPFVVAGAFARPFLAWAARHRRLMGHVERVMGAMLLLFAGLIAFDRVNLIAARMIANFDWSWALR